MLAVLAVGVAVMGPRLLGRCEWPDRSPRLGIFAWQALSGSVVGSAVLAGLALALPETPLSADLAALLTACADALRSHYATPGGAAASVAGGLLAVAVAGRVVCCLIARLMSSYQQRRRQLDALALAHHGPGDREVLIVDHPVPAAYCLSGRRERIVVTTGAVAALECDQLKAVLAHERAHLDGKHDLLLVISEALRRAFPRLRVFRDAHAAMARLVEMRADDVAARRHDRLAIATALVRMADGAAPAAALGIGGNTSVARVRRLVAPAKPLSAAGSAIAVFVALALLAAPVVAVTAPALEAAAELCPIDFSGSGTPR